MVYFSFVNIQYIICDCGNTFPTEEELKEHLETEHTNGDILEYESAPITISEKIDSNQKLYNLNEKSVGDNLELVVLDEELEYVQFLDDTNQPVLTIQVKGGETKENREAVLSEVNNAFKVQKKHKSKIKGKTDIIHETISRAMGYNYRIQAHRHKPEEELDQAVIAVTKLSFEQAVTELQRRKESKGYIAASHHCQFCYRHFHRQEQFEEHMVLHNEVSGSLMCGICKIRRTKRNSLRNHVIHQHTRKYSCKICPFTTTYESNARKHVAFHKGTKHRCPHCPKEFANETTRESHIRLKHPARHACGLCGHTFLSQFGVHLHRLKRHHLDKQLPLNGPYCEVCDVQFLSQEAHDRHLQLSSLHITDVTNRVYNQYQNKPKTTNPKEGNPKEMPKTRRAKKGPVHCEQCGVELAGLPEYGLHFRREHPGAVRTSFPDAHECQTCGKLFTHKLYLSLHMRAHAEKQFPCEQCGRRFVQPRNLSLHMQTHAEKQFPCERCGRRFMQPGNLRRHMQAHERSEERTTNPCHICGKHFTAKGNLARHIKLHLGIKEFQCEICGKSFSSKIEKTSHVNHVHLKIPRPPRAPRRPREIRGPDHLRLKISRQPHARKRRPDHEMSGPNHDTKGPDNDTRGPNHIEMNGLDHIDMRGRGHEEMRGPDYSHLNISRQAHHHDTKGPNHDTKGHDNDTRGSDHVVMRGPNHIEMNGLDHIDMRGRGHEEMRGPDHSHLNISRQAHHHDTKGPNHDTKGHDNDTRGPDHVVMRGLNHIEMNGLDHIDMRGRVHEEMRGPDRVHLKMPRPTPARKSHPDHKMRGSDPIKRGPEHKTRGTDRIEIRRPDHIQIRGSHHVDLKGLSYIDIRDLDHIDMLD